MSDPVDRPEPPALARWLLRLLVRGEAREVIAGDLQELWHESLEQRGGRAARRLYWSLALASALAARSLPRSRTPSPHRRGDHPMADLLRDLGFGFRLLLRRPAFSLTAVLVLALGIGAVTASYSLLHTVLVRPLPYRDATQVAFLLGWDTREDRMRFNVSYATFDDLRQRSRSFTAMAAYRSWSANLEGRERPERIQAYRVTDGTFPLLGVAPALGRPLEGEGEALLSWRLFQRRFAGDRALLGRSLTLDGEPYTVVGVMPPSFEFPVFNFRGDLWTAWRPDTSVWSGDRSLAPSVVAVGRLRAGIELATAQAELDRLSQELARSYPATEAGRGVRVLPMQELLAEQMGAGLRISFLAVVVVLVLICVTVANLLLVRAVERSPEMAIRSTLGAGTARLVRQLLAEGLSLALLAGLLGTLLAAGALRALRSSLPDFFVRSVPSLLEVGLHPPVLLLVLAVTTLAAMLFALAPAWGCLGIDLRRAVHGAGGSRSGGPLRKVLVAIQVALALVLLLATGLLLESFERLLRVDPGFEPERVLAMSVSLPASRYPDAAGRRLYYRQSVERVQALPGVETAAWVNTLPFSTSDSSTALSIAGHSPASTDEVPRVGDRAISPGYFEALGIPLLAGRTFTAADWEGESCVAIVNRTLERTLLDGRALGRRLRPGPTDGDGPWCEVIGVVGDVLHWELTRRPRAEIFLPLPQWTPARMTLAVRTTPRPESSIEPVRAALLELAPHQPVYDVTTLERLVGNSLAGRTVALASLGGVGATALLLAVMGLYGVVAYALSQRRPQLGIRIALGARFRHTTGTLLAEGLAPALVGAGVGLLTAAALTSTGALDPLLFEVSPRDPWTFAAATALLLVSALAACALPAWRARRIDPAQALRTE